MPNKGKGSWSQYGSQGCSRSVDVKLPPKMKCYRCDKNKGSIANFSSKEQDRAREAIQYTCAVPKDLKCITCTTGQNTEMKCIMCDQVKGLELFAKTHRRNPEQAKCKRCMNEQTSWDPQECQERKDDSFDDEENFDGASYDDEYEYGSRGSERSCSPAPQSLLSFDDDHVSQTTSSWSVDETTSLVTTSLLTSGLGTSEQSTSGSSGGVKLSRSSDASEFKKWSTVSNSRHRGLASAGLRSWSMRSVSGGSERATVSSENSSPRTDFNPNMYRNPIHSSSHSPNSATTQSRRSTWAKPKTVLLKPTLPPRDDDDSDAVPAITKAPGWDSDSDDDGDD